MDLDKGLLKVLVEKLAGYQASVPVYPIPERSAEELTEAAIQAGQRFAQTAGYREMRYNVQATKDGTLIRFQEGLAAHVFLASGAVSLHRGWQPLEQIITPDAAKADINALQRQAEDAVARLKLAPSYPQESLRFERLWSLKATGLTKDGKPGAVALTRVVGAFRRVVGSLPVWGRASVFVQISAEAQIAAAGVDWRPIAEKAIDTARVIAPDDGAVRVLTELQSYRPDEVMTSRDYLPEFFALGYLSLPKRRAQTVMQPVYVAMLRPVRPFPSLARLIVVPAGTNHYEPICRTVTRPPIVAARRVLPAKALAVNSGASAHPGL